MKKFLLRQFDRLVYRAVHVATGGNPKILEIAGDMMKGTRVNVLRAAAIKAGLESAAYYEERMLKARAFRTREDLLHHAVGLAKPDGLFLEFGVATGGSIKRIAAKHTGRVFGFDSFEGLPEDWDGAHPKGRFATEPPNVPANVVLIKGLFSDTLPRFIAEQPELISFLHIDCDLYSSTKCVFDQLGSKIVPGTVIVFDEYFNYPGWRHHEFKAFQEFVAARGLNYRYDCFFARGTQVCVVILPADHERHL